MIDESPLSAVADSIGVVIVNFNGGKLILKCINAVLDSSISVEIAVTDNGSTDGSLEALQTEFSNHAQVTIIANDTNSGFATGSNRALSALGSSLQTILFLNPDCLIGRHTLQKMLLVMQQSPEMGMGGCLILNEDGSEQRGCRRNEPTPLRAFSTMVKLGQHLEGVNRVGELLPDKPVEVDAISGAFMLVRRTALTEVGLMDEAYFLHCEDLDWCKRFRQQGWKVIFVPQVAVTHLKGSSSHGRPIRVEWHKHRGMIRYYRKFYKDKHPFYVMWTIYLAVAGRFILLLPRMILRNLRT